METKNFTMYDIYVKTASCNGKGDRIMIMDRARSSTRYKPHRKQCIRSSSYITLPW
jgi:hypothetical protein